MKDLEATLLEEARRFVSRRGKVSSRVADFMPVERKTLEQQLRRQRQLANAGSPLYDFNRHVALHQALGHGHISRELMGQMTRF